MAQAEWLVEPSGATHYITPDEYATLLARLKDVAHGLAQSPDAVVGMVRSGLFPAVYLSHQLELPMFVHTEPQRFPVPRLHRPLIVDTTSWSGTALRRAVRKFEAVGASPQVLVMFACANPIPAVDGLNYLETSTRIPRFWYEQ